MGGVRVRVVPVRGDAPRGRVVRLPAGTGGFRHGGSCGACVSRRRGWRSHRHGGAARAGRGVAAAPAVVPCLPGRVASAPAGRARAGAAGGRTGAVPCTPVRADPYRRVVPIRSARADPHRVMPAGAGGAPAPAGRAPDAGTTGRRPARWCGRRNRTGTVVPYPPEAGGFRTGRSCSCRCGWRPYRRCAVHAGTGGPLPTGGADQVGAGGPAPGGAVPAGSGRLPHRRVVLVPVRLAAVPALCRARRYGWTPTDGWCRSGRRGRTRAGWCRPVRAGRPRRVVPGCRVRRGRPARVRRVRTSGR